MYLCKTERKNNCHKRVSPVSTHMFAVMSQGIFSFWDSIFCSRRVPWNTYSTRMLKPTCFHFLFICFPSLPQMHTKREGPCDLKIQFANVQSLLVINSPLKMCRACTFKCKCLTGLRAGESDLSTRLQAHTDWHLHHWTAVPMS